MTDTSQCIFGFHKPLGSQKNPGFHLRFGSQETTGFHAGDGSHNLRGFQNYHGSHASRVSRELWHLALGHRFLKAVDLFSLFANNRQKISIRLPKPCVFLNQFRARW